MKQVIGFFGRFTRQFVMTVIVVVVVSLIACATNQTGENKTALPTVSTASAGTTQQNQTQQQQQGNSAHAESKANNAWTCPKNNQVLACYNSTTGWNDWRLDPTWFVKKDKRLGTTGIPDNYQTRTALLTKPLPRNDNYTVIVNIEHVEDVDAASSGVFGYYNMNRGSGYGANQSSGRPGVAIIKYDSSQHVIASGATRTTRGREYTLAVRFVNKVVSLWINGELQIAQPIENDNETGPHIGIFSMGSEFIVNRVLVVKADNPMVFG